MATVNYTSGTTGPPKGVVLDHRNIVWTLESFSDTFEMDVSGFRVVSYLPMAHIAERMVSHYMATAFGFEVTTCPDTTQVVAYLTQTHPELFFAVPRIWEKAYAPIRSAIGADPERAAAFDAALEIGWQASEHRARNEDLPADLAAAFEKADAGLAPIRQLIGLDEARTAISGAAPIPYEILHFFRGLGVPLSEIYGLSETTGPMTWTPFRVRIGTVGPPLPGVEVRLEEDGEVSCRGGNVFRGYLDSPEKTAEVLDDDGWFHSGDIGVMDDDGYLRIVDRKKELIITAGGKNISPRTWRPP
ncbi:MAG: AMP-binding protein [Acidimicrobiia bacterium]|nr:AMP-binding protein [Acidimicrobiia bacterium]